jgi:DNA topoisomerase-3
VKYCTHARVATVSLAAMPRRALHVAEKPSVAKELAAILSSNRHQTRRGQSPFNPIFEFDGTLDGAPCQTLITSVLGHLMEIEFDEHHRKWNSCPHGALFDAPLLTSVRPPSGDTNYQHVAANLETSCRNCSDLILWLDCDREGEAIGFEVINICRRVNSRVRCRRARFSALIPRDIHHALANLVQPDENQSEAVLARMEIDLRLGAAFTRMQTTALQNRFDGLGDSGPLSYGPCQFPTMWFVAQRAERISKFVTEEFWQIELKHNATAEDGEPLEVRFAWGRHRLFDRLAALVLYEMCVERGVASITSVTARPTSRRRPTPLATVELQRDASSKLRIPSDRTMDMAEKLYQRGYLSYPRTETDGFKQGFDLMTLIQAQWCVRRPPPAPPAARRPLPAARCPLPAACCPLPAPPPQQQPEPRPPEPAHVCAPASLGARHPPLQSPSRECPS